MYSQKPKLHERQNNYIKGNLATVSLDVTSKCNMRCPHCYAATYVGGDEVSLDLLLPVLEELYQMGVYHYVLQGGEPIISKKRLQKIIGAIHPEETYINVVSNGWEMSSDNIRFLKDIQVDKIAFSLDSGIEKEHDENRGKGSFGKVMSAIDEVLRQGLLASISIVVTRDSLYSEGFDLAYRFAENKGIRLDVQIAEPVGKWDGKKDLLMRPMDSAYIKKLQQNCIRLPNGQRMISRDIYSDEGDHCPAGIEFMAIAANGDVLPCNFLQFTLGNVAEKSFKEMRDSLISNKWFCGKPECLCGENDEFIDTFITPYINDKKPLDAINVFGLKDKI